MSAVAQYRPAQLSIDHAALRHNLATVRELCSDAAVMAVIKADGYGHGLLEVASALHDADEFAVNGMDEAQQLRKHGVDKPLTVLSETNTVSQLNSLSALRIRPTIFDKSQLQDIVQINADAALSVWLKVDTGMGRLGFAPEQLPFVVETLKNTAGISEISLMTHMANSENADHPGNQQQIALFEELAQQHKFSQLSVLNSGGIINFSANAKDVVRPGIMLYGVSPSNEVPAAKLGLQPVMRFTSKLLSVKELPAGSYIGYGSTYRLEKNTTVGVVACGYGDGYPRHAKSGTPVFINGNIVPVIGRVSMDLITVDISRVAAEVGDEVELWGANNPVETVAEAAETIGYELCCGILPRVARVGCNRVDAP